MTPCYPCPCCGYLVFSEPPGSFEVCPICYWEDDHVQLRYVNWAGGANQPNLIDGQRTYAAVGAMDTRSVSSVRAPRAGDLRDPDWRPASLADVDPHEPGRPHEPYPDDMTRLYCWTEPSYWRAR